jgi:ankyrin repeat protein
LTKKEKLFINSSKKRDEDGHTSFHVACSNGSTDIVELIIKKSIDLNIDLNAKYRTWGWTGFYLAHRIQQPILKLRILIFTSCFFSEQVLQAFFNRKTRSRASKSLFLCPRF